MVTLAPAVAQTITAQSLAELRIPVVIIVGDSDRVAPPSTNAEYVAANFRNANIRGIERGGHYLFLNECAERGKALIPTLCLDSTSATRADVQSSVIRMSVHLFQNVSSSL